MSSEKSNSLVIILLALAVVFLAAGSIVATLTANDTPVKEVEKELVNE